MKESINQLINDFEKIRKKGFIKAINNYNGSIGTTFENLLGKRPDDFSYPDYLNIELKTKVIESNTERMLLILHIQILLTPIVYMQIVFLVQNKP